MSDWFIVSFTTVIAIGVVVASIYIYFIPVIVARRRNHPNSTSIGILNIFLGWTIFGWVGALVWAYKVKE